MAPEPSRAAGERDPGPERATWLDAARGIAAHLRASARWRGDACHWADPGRGTGAAGGEASAAAAGRLELGSAGVALFLLRLHGAEPDDACVRTARGALAHALEREAVAGVAHGWYAGTPGVAAACAELGARTGDGRWLDDALSLCRLLERVPAPPACDVASGDAGSVLGLLCVHGLTGDGRTLEAAVRLGERLLARRRREADGISWNDPGGALSRNLLGLPHGAGGIGLALLELHGATGDPRFLAGAVQALRYEDAFFDPVAGDWPDLWHPELSRHAGSGRLHQLRRAAAEDALPGPSVPRPSPTWRHGTAGIALVRARFAEATGAEAYRRGVAHAAARCRERLARPGEEDTLALGRFGCADALLECARRHGGRADARAAADAAREAIEGGRAEAWRRLPAGLLHGSAGIGMFLLRLAAPEVASPLLPGSAATRRCGEEEVARAALEGAREHFARTERALAGLGVPLPVSGPVSPAELRERLDALVPALPGAEREKVAEVFALESLAHRLLSEHADRSPRLGEALLRPRPELLEQPGARVRLAATARAFRAAYDWEPVLREEAGVADLRPAPGAYLVHDMPGGYVARRLDGVAAAVAASLEAGVRVDELLADVAGCAGPAGGDPPEAAAGEGAVRARVLRTLRQMYELGIVEIDDPHGLRPPDVTSDLCTRCGECCRVRLYLAGDAGYRDYVAAALEAPLRAAYPAMTIGHERSRGEERVVLDLGHCHHLRRETDESGHESFRCGIYESRPEVCRTFNCVSWWRLQRANATGPTVGDAVVEKVAALRKEVARENPG